MTAIVRNKKLSGWEWFSQCDPGKLAKVFEEKVDKTEHCKYVMQGITFFEAWYVKYQTQINDQMKIFSFPCWI